MERRGLGVDTLSPAAGAVGSPAAANSEPVVTSSWSAGLCGSGTGKGVRLCCPQHTSLLLLQGSKNVCVCVRVCVRVRVCARACVRAYVCVHVCVRMRVCARAQEGDRSASRPRGEDPRWVQVEGKPSGCRRGLQGAEHLPGPHHVVPVVRGTPHPTQKAVSLLMAGKRPPSCRG